MGCLCRCNDFIICGIRLSHYDIVTDVYKRQGILTQGEVVALVNYMSQILVELIKLANLIVQVTKAVACGNRIDVYKRQALFFTFAAISSVFSLCL